VIFTATKLPGAHIIDIERREDPRGFFARAWCRRELEGHGLLARIEQVNVGFTRQRGGVRGMHFQLPPRQEVKIVRCTMGALYDVILDLRPESPTHRQWIGVELNADNRRMLYVPEGCAHGYQTLADETELSYETSAVYAPELARGVRYDDPAFEIAWPIAITSISDADRSWPDYENRPVVGAVHTTEMRPET